MNGDDRGWFGRTANRLRKLKRRYVTVELFSIYNLASILIGGAICSYFMRPDLASGPVRSTVYLTFGIGSTVLAAKYLFIILKSDDDAASLFVVASFYWWASFASTGYAVQYLILARAFGLWPHWGEAPTERLLYFFIGGAAIGLLFKAVSFVFVPTEVMIGRKVSAYPITLLRVFLPRSKGDAE